MYTPGVPPSQASADVDRLFARAVRARSKGNVDGALKALVEALELAPRKARLWIEVADCQRDMGHGGSVHRRGARPKAQSGRDPSIM